MYRSHKDQGLVFIGIHCDQWKEGLDAAKTDKIEYTVFNDDSDKSQNAYHIEGYPTVFVIDKTGVIRSVDPRDLDAEVTKLLAE